MQVSPDWEDLIRRFVGVQNRRLVIGCCGGNGLGKSNFLNALIDRFNSVGTSVCMLETDLRAPIHTPPGMVSIKRCGDQESSSNAVFVGDYMANQVPITYLRSIQYLLEEDCFVSERVVIINTHGWTVGLGAHLVLSILNAAKVTHVVHFKSIPDDLDFANVSASLREIFLPTPIVDQSNSSRDLYFTRLLSYFGIRVLQDLVIKTPLSILLKDVKVVRGPSCPDSAINMLHILNRSLVGLCSGSRCWGLGFVVAIDEATERLYIQTPIDQVSMIENNVDTLVLNRMENPLQLLCERGLSNVAWTGAQPFFAFKDQVFQSSRSTNPKYFRRRRLENADLEKERNKLF